MQSLWMIVASFLFACMGVCVKLGSASFGSGELTFWRGLVGMAMMAALVTARRIPLATPRWRLQLTRGASGTAALMCYFYALGVLPLATAVTLNYTSPIFVALLLALGFRERIGPGAYAAVLLGFVGVVMLLQPTLRPELWPGALGGLGSGMIASIAYISVRELGQAGEPEARTVFWFSLMTTLVGLPFWLLAPAHPLGLREWAILGGVGLFGGFAQLAMTRAYRYGQTLAAASLAYTTVIFSVLFGALIWSERLPPGTWCAIALIILSGVAVSAASRRRAGPLNAAAAD